jgi:DNA-directed RNA polymerase II subunit RPB1
LREQVNVIYSDNNADKLILRIRVNDIEDEEEDTVCMYLKDLENELLHNLTLKGIHEIHKVTFSKYDLNEFNPVTGAHSICKDSYMIETDGVALAKVMAYKKVDFKRTVSNDIIEILKTLGIEAARQSLVNELRFVLSSYGIYVNYRHLATLCDIMT